MDNMMCTHCQFVGKPLRVPRGSLSKEILLWCLFLVPGLLYSTWRLSFPAKVCPACGATHMTRIKEPTGQQLTGK